MIKNYISMSTLSLLFAVSLLFAGSLSHAQVRKTESVSGHAFLWSDIEKSGYKKEVTEKRSRYTKHFELNDGSMKMYSSPGSMHYQTGNTWEEINLGIQTNTSGAHSSHPYFNGDNSFKTWYPQSPMSGKLYTSVKDGDMSEQIESMYATDQNGNTVYTYQTNTPQVAVSDNMISYSNLFPNTIVRYAQQVDGRKLDVELQSNQALSNLPTNAKFLVIKEKVTIPANWTVTETAGYINLFSGNTWVANFLKPTAFETQSPDKAYTSDEDFMNEGEISMTRNGNVLTLYTKFSLNWLKASNRQFPVRLDPTTNFYPPVSASPTSSMATGRLTSATSGKSAGFLRMAAAGTFAWAKFDITTLPAGATITTATYFGYQYSPTGTALDKIVSVVGMQAVDPEVAVNSSTTPVISNQINTVGPVYNSTYVFGGTNPTAAPFNWRSAVLTGNATADISNQQASQGWTCLGFKYTSGNTATMLQRGVEYAISAPAELPYLTLVYSTVSCTGTPVAGTATALPNNPCPEDSVTLSLTGATIAGELAYQWQRSIVNPITGPWVNIGTSKPLIYNPPADSTSWYRCIVTCTATGLTSTSVVSGVVVKQSFSPSSACYCTPTNLGSACITNVSFGTLNNTTPGCTGTNNYNFYTTPVANFSAGDPYTFSITTDANAITSVWIDYNHNTVFEPSEWNQIYTNSLSGSITFSIPFTALAGQTRMRVRSILTGNLNESGDACQAMGSGETEDYIVNISPGGPFDPGITAIGAPIGNNSCTDSNQTLTATVYNYGSTDISTFIHPITVTFTVDGPTGTNTYSQTIGGVLGSPTLFGLGGAPPLTFTVNNVNMFNGGFYYINAVVSCPTVGNASLSNDSLPNAIVINNYRPTAGPDYALCQYSSMPFGQGLSFGGCSAPIFDSVTITFTITGPCVDNIGSTGNGSSAGLPANASDQYACNFANGILPTLPLGTSFYTDGLLTVTNLNTAVAGSWGSEMRMNIFGGSSPVGANLYSPGLVGNPTNGASSNFTYSRIIPPTQLSTIFSSLSGGSSLKLGYWESYNDNYSLSDMGINAGGTSVAKLKIYYQYVPTAFSWYDVPTGGSSLYSFTPFNPLAFSNAVVNNSNVPGLYTFYAACLGLTNCRVPVRLSVKPTPTAVQDSMMKCEYAVGANNAIFDLPSRNSIVSGGLWPAANVDWYGDQYLLSPILTPATDTSSTNVVYSKVYYTYANNLQCATSDTMYLQVVSNPQYSLSITACDSYTWPSNGLSYSSSGSYTSSSLNPAGCVSVDSLNLTIYQSTSSTSSASATSSYTWPASGLTYTSSGTYSYTTVNAAGCDSIMSLNLTIYQSAVNMTLQNVVQISPSVFEYDIMLTNTGNTALALKGYSCGINHAVGMRNGGTLTHTFVSRDPSLAAIPNPVAGYTSSSNHLRITAANTTNGNEINLSPGLPVRIATMRVSNSVPFPADFIPSLALQTLTAVGKTACIANCIVTPPGSVYTINGVGNTSATGFIQGLTGVVNTPCLYLNKIANFAASMSQSSPVSCYGQSNGVAQISSSGTGSSSTGMYSINGGAMTAYASIPFSISNLAAATYTVALTSSNGCVSSSTSTISQPSLPTIVTTATACNSYTWQGVTYTTSGSATNTFISATGCDSIHTKNFLINYSDASSSSFTACGSYNWNGISYTTSGTYIQAYTNNTGCDSTLTLNLTVNPIPSPSISASGSLTFCDGMSIVLNANIGVGLTYQWKKNGTTILGATSNSYTASQSGSYTVEETNSSNCSAASSPQVVTVNNCNVSLQLKLFIQGYYDQASTMLPVLLNQLASTDNTLTDTILVELHNALYPFDLALSKKAVLHTNGSAVCTINYVNGNYYLDNLYYVAIRHRNGLLTWSANPIAFDSTTVVYDFSTSSSKAYGDNMLEVEPGVWAMYSADLNQDQNVDLLDMPILEADIAEYMFGYAATDLNGDGNTDLLDVIYMDYGIANYLFSMYPVSATLPTVSTNAIGNITYTTASSGGSISNNGGAEITARGICWSTSPNPTVSLSTKTIDGIGSGSFTSSITGLAANTTYYIRAYATNSEGTAYGNEVIFTTTSAPLAIGQYYQGGIVAYILQAGDPGYDANVIRGLIAAPSDQSTAAQWGCYGTSISGADGIAIGTGNQNTIDIMNGCGASGIAARICGDLDLNGYSDWYLPSMDELNKLYLNQNLIGGFSMHWYWSSSEFIYDNYYSAWCQVMTNGSQTDVNKYDSMLHVRPVRSFSVLNTTGVTTNLVTSIQQTIVTCGGSVVSQGGSPISARGVCWSTSPDPTVSLSTKTIDGSGIGSFTSSITGLNPGTTYHVRAYATSSAGTVYGNDLTFITASLAIGDNYGGGKVAYIYQPGNLGYVPGETHGLIAAPYDQINAPNGIPWGCIGTFISGTSVVLGTGQANTTAIVNGCSTTNIPARICDNLVLNGYSDWYLPSKQELAILRMNRFAIGGFQTFYYWSSSEIDGQSAWGSEFVQGFYDSSFSKIQSWAVRAVRSF